MKKKILKVAVIGFAHQGIVAVAKATLIAKNQVEVIKDFINKVYKPTGYKTKTKFEMLVELKKLEQELKNS